MGRKGKAFVKYAVTGAIGLALGLLVASGRGFSLARSARLNARYLSDGMFVSGFLLAGTGVLAAISTGTDFFDIFRYGVKSLLMLFTALKKPGEFISYAEYKAERGGKRGKPVLFLLFTGLGIIALSLFCLLAYYRLL